MRKTIAILIFCAIFISLFFNLCIAQIVDPDHKDYKTEYEDNQQKLAQTKVSELIEKGNAEFENANYDTAKSLFEEALKTEPANVIAKKRLADTCDALGNYTDAIKNYEDILSESDVDIYLNLIALYLQVDNIEKAKEISTKAEAKFGEDPYVLNNIGLVYLTGGEGETTLSYFNKSFEIDEKLIAPAGNIGAYQIEINEINKAVEIFEGILSRDDKNMQAMINLSYCYIYQDKLKEAEDLLKKAIETDKTCALAHYNMALLLDKTGETDKSFDEYMEALRFGSGIWQAEMQMGISLLNDGNLDYAIGHFNRVKELSKNLPDGYLGLARIYIMQDSLDKADAELNEALTLSPDNIDALNCKGIILQKSSKSIEAITQFLKILEKTPDQPEICYNLGVCYEDAGQNTKAVKFYEKYLELYPDIEDSSIIKEKIQTLKGKEDTKDTQTPDGQAPDPTPQTDSVNQNNAPVPTPTPNSENKTNPPPGGEDIP